MKYLIMLLFCVQATIVFSQGNVTKNDLVQFSGIITDTDSNQVVPYVSIKNKSTGISYAANYQGYFSFVAKPGDVMLFTAIGFYEKELAIPTTVTDNKFTAMVQMKPEVVYLKAVRIYPWATVEEFNKEFLAMQVADDNLALAQKNLSKQSIQNMVLTLPRNSSEISNSNYRYNFDRMMNVNMRQTNPLLNPFAWGRLMQQIMNGDKSRSEN
ncbi:MAG: hypothetical protein EOO99_07765 [Pedobacter sp.]|nr:MAG: hypothetical protein EOO99_07765 [Pedobacter sp.]